MLYFIPTPLEAARLTEAVLKKFLKKIEKSI